MTAHFEYNGRTRAFETGIGERGDGTYGPAREVRIMPREARGLFDPVGPVIYLAYDHLDPEHDVLVYRVVRVEENQS